MKRTTHRSSSGKKLLTERNSDGTFKNVYTYKKSMQQDLKKRSKAELAKKKA